MYKKKGVAGAPITMKKRGRKTDALVLKVVQKNQRLTIRDIADELDWSNGRVDGSVNRLVKAGKVKVEHTLRRGALIKRVYGINYHAKPRDLVTIPRNVVDERLWRKSVQVYALSRSTIGISPREIEEWEKRALCKEKLNIEQTPQEFEVKIPDKLSAFYELGNSETSLSVGEGLAMLTVESTVLPVALPPTYPAQVSFRITREMHIKEKVEGVITYTPAVEIQADPLKPRTKIPLPSELVFSDIPRKTKKAMPKVISDSSETNELTVPIEVTS